MVLSAYERADSPFVWIQYGLDASCRQTLKTAIRKADPQKKAKTRRELYRIEAQLLPQLQEDHPHSRRDEWAWAPGFIRSRYAGRVRTGQVYLAQWRALREFLAEREIESPAVLTRDLVFEFPAWRTSQVKEKSKRHPSLNTALGELKLLALLMDEAVARHLAPENPARKLHIAREETKPRPEILDAELELIRRELPREERAHREWMTRSFELGLRTGLRFSTTRLHRSQVRWASDDLLIEKPKGGRKREFAIPIYESVRPLLKRFTASRSEWFWTAPEGTMVGLVWRRFFVRIGLPHLCFHCTRVTFITRGMRVGIPEPVMMKMVNHAGKEISRIYQRWTADDVRRYADRVPSL